MALEIGHAFKAPAVRKRSALEKTDGEAA